MKDRIGEIYGRFKVISFDRRIGADRTKYRYYWNCKCECGNTKSIAYNNLLSGTTKSCGCFRDEQVSKSNTTHGKMKGGRKNKHEFNSWKNMIYRCTDVTSNRYYSYGGLGITVCDRWLASFKNFLEDMNTKPYKNYSIDRIDNTKGYYKENCRWATPTEQAINRKTSKIVVNIITNKEYPTIAEAARHLNIKYKILYNQLYGKLINITNLKLK